MFRNSRYDLHASPCEVNNFPSMTSQGEAQSVYDLFQKMVLGQYTPSSLSNDDYDFDSPEGYADLDSVDDRVNRIGFTREEAFGLHEDYQRIGKSELDKVPKIPSEAQEAPSEPQTPPEGTSVQ